MQVFYLPGMKRGTNILSQEESHHCARVLRIQNGEEASFIDGEGGIAIGRIGHSDPLKTKVEIQEIQNKQYPEVFHRQSWSVIHHHIQVE